MQLQGMTKEEFQKAMRGYYKLGRMQRIVMEFIDSDSDYASVDPGEQKPTCFHTSFNHAAKSLKANCYCIMRAGKLYIIRGKRAVVASSRLYDPDRDYEVTSQQSALLPETIREEETTWKITGC